MQAHMFGYDQNTKCSSTREDDNRIRQGHAQHNLAILRRLALNLLRREKSAKIGMAAKRQRDRLWSSFWAKLTDPKNRFDCTRRKCYIRAHSPLSTVPLSIIATGKTLSIGG